MKSVAESGGVAAPFKPCVGLGLVGSGVLLAGIAGIILSQLVAPSAGVRWGVLGGSVALVSAGFVFTCLACCGKRKTGYIVAAATAPVWAPIVVPMAGIIYHKKVGKHIYHHILTPVGEVMWQMVATACNLSVSALKFLCVTISQKLWEKVVWPTLQRVGRLATWVWEHIVTPVGRLLKTTAELFYQHVVLNVVDAVCTVAKHIYKHILTPIGQCTAAAAKFLFVTVPLTFWKWVVAPALEQVARLAKWVWTVLLPAVGHALVHISKLFYTKVCVAVAEHVYKHILTPIAEVGVAAAQFLFVTLPSAFWKHIGAHVWHATTFVVQKLWEATTWTIRKLSAATVATASHTYRHILTPVGQVSFAAARFLFATVPSLFWRYVGVYICRGIAQVAKYTWRATVWTCSALHAGLVHSMRHILTPVGEVAFAAAKFLFVTLPCAFWKFVGSPVCQATSWTLKKTWGLAGTVLGHVFRNILSPVGSVATVGMRLLFIDLPVGFWHWVGRPVVSALGWMLDKTWQATKWVARQTHEWVLKPLASVAYFLGVTIPKALLGYVVIPGFNLLGTGLMFLGRGIVTIAEGACSVGAEGIKFVGSIPSAMSDCLSPQTIA